MKKSEEALNRFKIDLQIYVSDFDDDMSLDVIAYLFKNKLIGQVFNRFDQCIAYCITPKGFHWDFELQAVIDI